MILPPMSSTMSSLDKLDLPRYLYTFPTDYELYVEYTIHWQLVKRVLYRTYLRTILSERQNHKCCYCGEVVNDVVNSRRQVTLEHIIPESMGGATDLWNCVVAHRKCNNKRGCDYLPEQDDVVFGRSNDEQFLFPYGSSLDYYGNRL